MKILLTRPLKQSQELEKELVALNHQPIISPLLQISYNDSVSLDDIDQFDAIIITSRNALEYIKNFDKNLKLVIVGKQTSEYAKQLGFKDVIYAGYNVEELKKQLDLLNMIEFPASSLTKAPKALKIGDNSNEIPGLAASLLARDDASIVYPTIENGMRCLYLCGDHVTDDLSSRAQRRIIYKSSIINDMSDELYSFFDNKNPKIVTLFSYRTAESFLSLVNKYNLQSNCANVIILALSEKIITPIKSLECKKYYVAETPELQSIVNLINRVAND